MPCTIIGPTTEAFPKSTYPPILEIKRLWGDTWRIAPDLELVSAQLATGGHDLGRCQFRRRYGPAVKQPWEADYSARGSWATGAGWWVQLRIVCDQGLQPVWIGRIAGESRNVYGSEGGRMGAQSWTAYGPTNILRKIAMSNSYWWDGALRRKLGWVPSINDRDQRNMIVGNRSAEKHDGVYLYGGEDTWTHLDYLEYVLDRFVDETADGGPSWTIGGQADLLAGFSENIRLGTTQTIDQVLAQLIPPRLGVDYKIVHHEGTGFEVHVFALSAREFCFANVTLPKNPNTVAVRSGETRDNLQTRVVATEDHRYGRIRVLGKRAVVCCSLAGPEYWDAKLAGSLVPKWHDDLLADYKDGTGNAADPDAEHDAVRRRDHFRPVYQYFGAPDDWTHQDGAAAPYIDAAGQHDPLLTGQHQLDIRSTLSWLPLREGFDYSVDPAVDNNVDGYQPEFRPAACWILAEAWGNFHDPEVDHSQPCEAARIGVSAAQTDWGVCLNASPNHRLAMNHWFPAKGTENPPVFDYDRLVATIAFESDQRLRLELEIPGGAKPTDGTLDIEVPDAEFWFLAARTIVDVDPEPWEVDKGAIKEVLTSGDTGRVLRNDVDRLAAVMAGAIARYFAGRMRGVLVIKGLVPWGPLLGHILTVIEEAGDTHQIQAPITQVAWMGGEKPQTIISTGFAQ